MVSPHSDLLHPGRHGGVLGHLVDGLVPQHLLDLLALGGGDVRGGSVGGAKLANVSVHADGLGTHCAMSLSSRN